MTSEWRIMGLVSAVRHLSRKEIPSEHVECEVWCGVSATAMAQTLIHEGGPEHSIWLHDTFEGMTAPTWADVDHSGKEASATFDERLRGADYSGGCYSPLEEVQSNMRRINLAEERVHFIKGDVSCALRTRTPESTRLLPLNPDWFESSRDELKVLYPHLSPLGVCIVDDDGHWEGARKAVDEYFDEIYPRSLRARLDYTGRMWVKA